MLEHGRGPEGAQLAPVDPPHFLVVRVVIAEIELSKMLAATNKAPTSKILLMVITSKMQPLRRNSIKTSTNRLADCNPLTPDTVKSFAVNNE